MKTIPGNTPLVRLEDFGGSNRLYAKVEGYNPSGSIKDRAVYQMLLDYRARGVLKPGCTIIEATSGNTGIALSFFQKVFDYKAVIVMPSSMSMERRKMIAQYGAELCLVDGGMKQTDEKARELLKNIPNSFLFGQFENPMNVYAHKIGTGPEILKEVEPDYVFAGIGTGGTAMGLSECFQERGVKTKVIGVEPAESPLLTEGRAGPHKIQGIGANFVPPLIRKEALAGIVPVEGEKAVEFRKELVSKGYDVGISAAAALLGALAYIEKEHLENRDIVVIFPDKGDRYS